MSAPYTLEKVNELAGGDESFVTILVQTFLEEVPDDLASMAEAVENNNAALAYQFAHKMKPNFQLFGIEVVDKVKLIESWSSGQVTQSEAEPALRYVQSRAKEAIDALKRDFNL